MISMVLVAYCRDDGCPANIPTSRDTCNTKQTCYYGEECCCDKCYSEVQAECTGEMWIIAYLDNCLAGCPCTCTEEVNPVCGKSGKKYMNPCRLECAKDEVAPCPCRCTREYEPVCGETGMKYPNPCVL